MKPLEKGFYYNFKHDPGKGVTNFAYFILPYPAGSSEDPGKRSDSKKSWMKKQLKFLPKN
jgi:hypothetical protein